MIIIVLANSKKLGGRCVAGIDLETGRWIRPVSPEEHGELSLTDCSIASGKTKRLVQPLDLIEISVIRRKPGIGHPEDNVTNHGSWKFVKTVAAKERARILDPLTDNDDFLFGDSTNSVSESDARSGSVHKSLSLIKINSPRFHVLEYKNQLRATFTYSDNEYDLPVTDLEPWVVDAKRSPSTFSRGTWFFTTSLGEPFNGRLYKLIACCIQSK